MLTEELVVANGLGYVVYTDTENGSSILRLVKTQTNREDNYCKWNNERNLVVIDSVNSGVGRNPSNDYYNIVFKHVLEDLGYTHDYIKTSDADTVSQFARSLESSTSYDVIFMSGDTAISEFINNLPPDGACVRILPIPLGSGNAWASSLGFTSPVLTFGAFLKGKCFASQFPLYKAVFPNGYSLKFFIVLSLGFHANLLHLCDNPKYNLGTEKFRIASEEIFNNYILDEKIQLLDDDGNQIKAGKYAYFVIINTSHLEPEYIPSPSSKALVPDLYLLAYDSQLEKEYLASKIMQGYSNRLGQSLVGPGITYEKLPRKRFKVLVENDKANRRDFEICIDGHLLNLLDLQPSSEPKDFQNWFYIETLPVSPNILALTQSDGIPSPVI
ncbi:HHR241Cp [Eremothecium sinecaudum]|uniref:HHR241Cp n=1 Tax=Eremothecium sinecaudum TaxID=45286 RepID=A0A109V0I5_9SACH|nr:HHR241Cp [Eremothecium sinecaudum]AMD23010.1 HHR241Cp [Eremothecium sinecaudum]